LAGAPRWSSPTDESSSESLSDYGAHYGHSQNCQVTVDMLPDEILVEIFKFSIWAYLGTEWYRLVHVCRRWRYVVLASPRYLDLKVEHCGRRPTTEMPKVWQTLPIALQYWSRPSRDENLIAVLESKHYSRVCEINLINFSLLPWERFIAAMQKPFPELTDLSFSSSPNNKMPILPASFLGGSAPRLRALDLQGVPPGAVQRLLLSANNLVYLSLRHIPYAGYNSPEDMATCVSGLTRLENLNLHFCPPRSHRLPQVSRQILPPFAPFVLPALTEFIFEGHSYYLERLVAQIDAPLLLNLRITFLQYDVFDLPQLGRFISHTEKHGTHARAMVSYFHDEHRLTLSPQPRTGDSTLVLGILYDTLSDPHRPLSSLTKVCHSSLPLYTLEELDITWGWPFQTRRNEREERMQWLQLLALFTSVTNLRLGKEMATLIIHALKELDGEKERSVLPALQSLFIEGLQSSEVVQDVAKQFVAARQLSERFVVVHDWKR